MSERLTILDYGLGNLHSVVKSVQYVGATAHVATDGRDLKRANRVILPGVGAFSDGLEGLRQRGMVDPLLEHASRGKPLLGICLGMQLLLSESTEFGTVDGLGIIPGRVERISNSQVRVPHVGWGRLLPARDWANSPLASTESGAWAYFVHSYHALPDAMDCVIATVRYGPIVITAGVHSENVTGLQFHPEKSGQVGLDILQQFCSS